MTLGDHTVKLSRKFSSLNEIQKDPESVSMPMSQKKNTIQRELLPDLLIEN